MNKRSRKESGLHRETKKGSCRIDPDNSEQLPPRGKLEENWRGLLRSLGQDFFFSAFVLFFILGLRVHFSALGWRETKDVVEKQKRWLVALDERKFHPQLLEI